MLRKRLQFSKELTREEVKSALEEQEKQRCGLKVKISDIGNSLIHWCCFRPMMALRVKWDDLVWTQWVCRKCGSLQFRRDYLGKFSEIKRSKNNVFDLRDNQYLRRKFPKTYTEYQKFQSNWYMNDIILLEMPSFKDFLLKKYPQVKSSIQNFIDCVDNKADS